MDLITIHSNGPRVVTVYKPYCSNTNTYLDDVSLDCSHLGLYTFFSIMNFQVVELSFFLTQVTVNFFFPDGRAEIFFPTLPGAPRDH